MSLRVEPLGSRRARRLFLDLPRLLHGEDPAFVPPILASFGALLDRAKNPYWRNAEAQEFLAWRGERPVGRIGACHDRALEARAPGTGAIGLFECERDPATAAALFEAGDSWLRGRGLRRARGPLNYSIHDTAGLLVEGFDTPPTVDTTWNPPYYGEAWEREGWRPAQDMIGAGGMLELQGPQRMRAFADLARKRGVVARRLDLSRFAEEVETVRQVYNSAWNDNWGHVPVEREEFAYKAKDLKAVLDRDLVRIAECDGKAIGMFLALPDLNVAARRTGGRLFPLGWWHLMRSRRTAGRVRVVALGVVPGHRRRGVEALLLCDSFAAIGARYPWCEASWVLADNAAMMNGLAIYNLLPYKKWRLYEREFQAPPPAPVVQR